MRNKLFRQHFLASFSLLCFDDLQYIPESLVGDDVGRIRTGLLHWNRGTIGASGKLPFGDRS
jgi:hypothetical protein